MASETIMPFNAELHAKRMAEGWTWERVPAEWSDEGSPESGPEVVGFGPYDFYVSPDGNECQYADENSVSEVEPHV